MVNILILGASGELGGALAAEYARPGAVLHLWGRDLVRLEKIATQCRRTGADVAIRSLDLVDIEAAVTALCADDDSTPFNLAVFASGRGDIRKPGHRIEQPELVANMAAVNFTAPAALATCLADRMAARKDGSIVIIGSAAAFHALPFATAYAGTKAGLACFADALRLAMRPFDVRVTLISPGFLNTAAARQVPGPRPFTMQPEEAARRIVRAASCGQAHAIFPWPFRFLRLFDRLLPRFLRDRLLLALTPRELRI